MTKNSALNDLWEQSNQQSYHNSRSYTCVKQFVETVPKQITQKKPTTVVATFVPDVLKWDGTVYGGNKKT